MNDKLIAIHGLGYVGLTAAVHYAKVGWTVLAYDPDTRVVGALAAGRPRAGDFLAYLHTELEALLERGDVRRPGCIIPTDDLTDVLFAPVHSIAVPTERAGHPCDDIVEGVLHRLIEHCDAGTLILVESTLSPGTMDRVLAKARRAEHHLLAVCPRRDWFADSRENLATVPRVVGGVTPAATQRAKEVLTTVSKHVLVPQGSEPAYRTAELTKALENAQLHVQVMMAHELAMNAPQHDVAEAIRLAGTHPRLKPLYIGFGSGGRCVPLGSQYLLPLHSHREASLLKRAGEVDAEMRVAVARAVARRACKTALVLGIAYRPGFKDAGLSPGLAVARHLRASFGVEVTVADPCWDPASLRDLTGFPVHETIPGDLTAYDAVLLATPHFEYAPLITSSCTWRSGQFVLDAHGTWTVVRDLLLERGVLYKQVGMAGWDGFES